MRHGSKFNAKPGLKIISFIYIVENVQFRKIHYPPETTSISIIIKLVAMYKQSEEKEQLFNAIQDFYHELINENLMISHKMLGENHQHDLNNLFNLFKQSFDFTGIESVSCHVVISFR